MQVSHRYANGVFAVLAQSRVGWVVAGRCVGIALRAAPLVIGGIQCTPPFYLFTQCAFWPVDLSRVIGQFHSVSNAQLPPSFLSSSPAIRIGLRQGYAGDHRSNAHGGFEATYFAVGPGHSCVGTVELKTSGGVFTDCSGTGVYAVNRDCRWLINNGATTTVYIDQFDLGSGDFVKIYDGSSTASPLLATFDNTNDPVPVTGSLEGPVLVRFWSDDAGVGDGFVATFTSGTYIPLLFNHDRAGNGAVIPIHEPYGRLSEGHGGYTHTRVVTFLIDPTHSAAATTEAVWVYFNELDLNSHADDDYVSVQEGHGGKRVPPGARVWVLATAARSCCWCA